MMGFHCPTKSQTNISYDFSHFYRQQFDIWSGSETFLCIFIKSCTSNATRNFYLKLIGYLRTTASLSNELTLQGFFSQENCGIKQSCQIFIQNLSISSTQHISFDWQSLPSLKVFGFWFLVTLFEARWLICSTMTLNKSFRNFFSDVVFAFFNNCWIFSLILIRKISASISSAVDHFSDGIPLPDKKLNIYLLWIFPDSTDSRLKFDPDPEQFFPYF